MKIAVIADDLTGGADTGVLFCPVVGPVYLTGVRDKNVDVSSVQTAGISLCTNSRHLSPAAAREATRKAAAKILAVSPGLVYKKVDSCLRGNPGTEIDTLLQEMGGDLSFIAPALPSQGRTTEGDIHRVHGLPVADTEAGRDPLAPVTTSRLSERIADKSKLAVGHVGLDKLEQGIEIAARHIRNLQQEGCSHIVFDAVTENHLDLIAALKLEQFKNETVLLAGSAGLAKALADKLFREGGALPVPALPQIQKWLFVCGSASRITEKQTAALAAKSGWPHRILEAPFLAAPGVISKERKEMMELLQNWRKTSLILSIAPVHQGCDALESPARVISGLAKIAALLLSETAPQGLFLSGGDTAQAVLQETGADGLLLHEEILPGLMFGAIEGGLCDKVPIVTKAGAFGTEDTLQQLAVLLT